MPVLAQGASRFQNGFIYDVGVRTKPYLQWPTTPKLQAAPWEVPQRAPIASASPSPPLLSRNKWMCKSTEMCLQEINYLSEIYCCEVSVILKSADIFCVLIGCFKQGAFGLVSSLLLQVLTQ